MKRKFEEEEEFEGREKKQRLWSDGEEWERGDIIGQGSFGSVFLAFSKKPDLELRLLSHWRPIMAVKSAELSASESIQHEAEVLSDIKGCPFVVEYLDEEITTCDDKEHYNLLMEFAAGGTLDGLIQRTKRHGLPESDVRRYTRCILEGIKHIHRHDYVHCDLKPENILLVPTTTTTTTSTTGDARFVAKIADLGLAKKTKEDVGENWRGTPMYLSPEALINFEQDQSSDIWSIGCIVLEMLTGKEPWDLKPGCDLEDFLDLMMFDNHCTPPIPAQISGAARDFLNRCLSMRSWERLTAEKLLSHPFVALPQPLEAGLARAKEVSSSSGYGDRACCFKPNAHYNTSSAINVPRMQPPPGFCIPAGL